MERLNFIPSSLDARPIAERYSNPAVQEAHRKPNTKYSYVKALVDHGKKEPKFAENRNDATQVVTKLRGELFSRIAPDAMARFLSEG